MKISRELSQMNNAMVILALALAAAPAAEAGEAALLGTWSGNDRASEAIYGKLQIGETSISWRGGNPYNPPCETTYALVSTWSDTTYPDNTFGLQSGRTFRIFKLKLEPKPCTGLEGYFQFALPTDEPGYAEVVTYGTDDEQTGWHNFSKIAGETE
ncbi:hypothetical protein [Thiohalocapsa sp. ML1]|jgi:hypothetical protein|uniref:hypothetical protein n=1 Tax=Thiohalocapsa sp. ML1 TaxID=1431688 RepID=UPI0012E3BF1F|nr:hypothetical protein [Thiohalocapsa sp. ML1]